ncbi:MAG TPA: FAD-dependent oxidoreductase [Streptosporangiaceae bacterium]|jgi:NADPH-dependent 2,4-dienoyl-CoA reductase/sulfur reductase-like enzyme
MRVQQVVIAGAGLAGLRTAEELRSKGYQGSITMIGAERRPPYDRPPLTKKFMTGELDDTSLAADMAALGTGLRLAERATEAGDGVLRTDRGEYPFDALVVATGSAPVRLPGPGPQRVIRTLDDALAVRSVLREGRKLAIVGAGWIGAELATAARAYGCQVTVVEAAPTPLHGPLGADVGARTAAWYAAAGVDLRLGEPVGSVEVGGLALASGEWLPADEIVTAVGVRPDVGWLFGSKVALDNGVAVDSGLRASVAGVYAVGDCASFVSRRYRCRMRVEHWDSALHAPTVVAANIAGDEQEYDPVPYFWSEQFGRMVQYAGHHTPADRLVWRGDPAAEKWSACWLAGPARSASGAAPTASAPTGAASGGAADGGGADGGAVESAAAPHAGVASGGAAGGGAPAGDVLAGERMVAVIAVGHPRDLLQGRRVIASGQPVDAAAVADPSIPLRDVVQSPR